LPEIDNSYIVQHVLDTLINISSRKTTKGLAVIKLSDSIEKLKSKYEFLKHIEVKDTRFIEMAEPITVMSDINKVESTKLGNALYDIIKNINLSLGKDAGHFFIKELRNNLEDSHGINVEEIGLDLGLMQLEHEIRELTKKIEK